MADLSITATAVLPAAGFVAETGYLSGAAITQGQSVYLDTAVSPPTWKLADADLSAIAAGSGGVGIALNTATAAAQPLHVMVSGTLALGAILTTRTIYCVSATAGGICPQADVLSAGRVTVLGIANGTSNLVMRPWATGI